jgi:hypothetical protein
MNNHTVFAALAALSINSFVASSAITNAHSSGKPDSDDGGTVALSCVAKKYPGYYFNGTLITIAKNIPNLELCIEICWKYNSSGKRCSSVNYMSATQACELMQDTMSVPTPPYGQLKEGATYAVPMSCE